MRKYSKFGLAFGKLFLIGKGAAPVFYLPKGVRLFGRSRAEILDDLEGELRRTHPVPPEGAHTWREPEPTKGEKFIEDIVLPYVKPFDETMAEDNPDNYYMEREWRTVQSIRFRLEDVQRVVIPAAYGKRLRENVPMYTGQVTFVP